MYFPGLYISANNTYLIIVVYVIISYFFRKLLLIKIEALLFQNIHIRPTDGYASGSGNKNLQRESYEMIEYLQKYILFKHIFKRDVLYALKNNFLSDYAFQKTEKYYQHNIFEAI